MEQSVTGAGGAPFPLCLWLLQQFTMDMCYFMSKTKHLCSSQLKSKQVIQDKWWVWNVGTHVISNQQSHCFSDFAHKSKMFLFSKITCTAVLSGLQSSQLAQFCEKTLDLGSREPPAVMVAWLVRVPKGCGADVQVGNMATGRFPHLSETKQ